jgi:hypothetical protein
MKWIDTHVHIAGALPDGTPKANLTDAVAAVLTDVGGLVTPRTISVWTTE